VYLPNPRVIVPCDFFSEGPEKVLLGQELVDSLWALGVNSEQKKRGRKIRMLEHPTWDLSSDCLYQPLDVTCST